MATLTSTTGNSTLDAYGAITVNSTLSFDSIVPIMIVGLGLALVGSAMFVRTQPIFFAIFFLINACLAYVSMFLSNVWYSIFTGNSLSATAATFTLWTVMFQYLPLISLIIGTVFAIAMFVKGD